MWARIENERVKEITDIDPEGRFHPSFFWVESPDFVKEGYIYKDGKFSKENPPVDPEEEIKEKKVRTVQIYMDGVAKGLSYDNIANAVTYAEEPSVPKFQAEGQALRAWRSLVWAKCYEILAEVEAGTRPIPSDSELIAALPALQLPEEV